MGCRDNSWPNELMGGVGLEVRNCGRQVDAGLLIRKRYECNRYQIFPDAAIMISRNMPHIVHE